jgi:hypothetical protein
METGECHCCHKIVNKVDLIICLICGKGVCWDCIGFALKDICISCRNQGKMTLQKVK